MAGAGTAAAQPLGSAIDVVPNALGILGGDQVTLFRGSDLYEGQTIETDENGEVQIEFVDDTRMVIGPNSSLVIERFLLQNQNTIGNLTVNALGGTFRFISGSSPSEAYQINTPTGTIAVRGTGLDLVVDRPTGWASVLALFGVVLYCPDEILDQDQYEYWRYDDLICRPLARCGVASFPTLDRRLLEQLPPAEVFRYAQWQRDLRLRFRIDGAEDCVGGGTAATEPRTFFQGIAPPGGPPGPPPEPTFCELNPTDPSCLPDEPDFCEMNPTDPSCVPDEPDVCERNPTDPSCVPDEPDFCELYPEDPSCVPDEPDFCELYPEDPSCLPDDDDCDEGGETDMDWGCEPPDCGEGSETDMGWGCEPPDCGEGGEDEFSFGCEPPDCGEGGEDEFGFGCEPPDCGEGGEGGEDEFGFGCEPPDCGETDMGWGCGEPPGCDEEDLCGDWGDSGGPGSPGELSVPGGPGSPTELSGPGGSGGPAELGEPGGSSGPGGPSEPGRSDERD